VLAPKTSRVIIETFRDLIKAALATVEKEFSALQGVTYTIERRADVSKQIDALFEKQFPLPALVEFSGMRGGATTSTTLPELTDEQRAAYAPLVKQLTPLWRRVTAYRRDYPESWTADVLRLPETTKLSVAEIAAMKAVVADIPLGRGTLRSSGGPITPVACAREHARLILGISQRNDKKLIEIVRADGA
jgi:hypothetical protein